MRQNIRTHFKTTLNHKYVYAERQNYEKKHFLCNGERKRARQVIDWVQLGRISFAGKKISTEALHSFQGEKLIPVNQMMKRGYKTRHGKIRGEIFSVLLLFAPFVLLADLRKKTERRSKDSCLQNERGHLDEKAKKVRSQNERVRWDDGKKCSRARR